MMPRRPRLCCAALLAIASEMLCVPAARADEVEACKVAAEQAEALRADAKLVAARSTLLACAREGCPPVLREACTRMFTEIEQILPSVIVRARDARGRDVIGVRVLVDGSTLLESLTGRAVPLDPGPHRIRYVVAGAPPVEEEVLIAEGDRQRSLVVTFRVPLQSDGSAEPDASAPAPPDTTHTSSPSTAPIWIAGGVGAIGLAAFTYLHLSAWGDYHDLVSTCGVTGCDPEEVDAVRTKLIVADVSLGVGVTAIGVGVVLALLRWRSPSDPPTASGFGAFATASPGGASGLVRGTF